MEIHAILVILLCLPLAGAAICWRLRSARAVLTHTLLSSVVYAGVAAFTVARVFHGGPIRAAGLWLFVDALSAYHLAVLLLVYLLSSFYAFTYFKNEINENTFPARKARTFGVLWHSSLAAMILVLFSNNMGIMWVGVEATTLFTTFLICTHLTPTALEATWKYLLICSVGVAFAFIGTLLVGASTHHLPLHGFDLLFWTQLRAHAGELNSMQLRVAFIFLLVGYGTKVGLAPMHSWLPDAHSQAPSPVSAIFSGFLLNTAFYCLLRFVPIVDGAAGNAGWAHGWLRFMGLISILVAAAFIVFQHDVKRLLAYSSVEHMGIISLGMGLGGFGAFAALLHTLNHSMSKSLAFFAAGRIGQIYGTHDMERISGVMKISRVWGLALIVAVLALIGVAPFAIFTSELLVCKAAVQNGSIVSLVLFLLGATVVFAGVLRQLIPMAWGSAPSGMIARRSTRFAIGLVLVPITLIVVLGLTIPAPLRMALEQAARIVEGTS